jgi:hypothetical protein
MSKSIEYYKGRIKELEECKDFMIKDRDLQYKRYEKLISTNAMKTFKLKEKVKRLSK